jgi:hypothetical protein
VAARVSSNALVLLGLVHVGLFVTLAYLAIDGCPVTDLT